MNRDKAMDALNLVDYHSSGLTGLLHAMRVVWERIDGVSDDTEAMRALIESAKRMVEDLDEQTATAIRELHVEAAAESDKVAGTVEAWFRSHRDCATWPDEAADPDGWNAARQRHDDLQEVIAATPAVTLRDVLAKFQAYRLHVAWWGHEGDAVRMADDIGRCLEGLAGGPLAVQAPGDNLDAKAKAEPAG